MRKCSSCPILWAQRFVTNVWKARMYGECFLDIQNSGVLRVPNGCRNVVFYKCSYVKYASSSDPGGMIQCCKVQDVALELAPLFRGIRTRQVKRRFASIAQLLGFVWSEKCKTWFNKITVLSKLTQISKLYAEILILPDFVCTAFSPECIKSTTSLDTQNSGVLCIQNGCSHFGVLWLYVLLHLMILEV